MTLFRRKHEHSYRPVAVEHRVNRASILLPATSVSTIILWRCDCESVHSQEVNGRWSLTQVRGEPDPTREELDAQMDAIVAARGSQPAKQPGPRDDADDMPAGTDRQR